MQSCTRVFRIQELNDEIRKDLSLKDIKACSLVCRSWHSYFNPHVWLAVSLLFCSRDDIELEKTETIQRNGRYISSLIDVYVDREILRWIQHFCPFVTSIDLILGKSFPKLNYWDLETFLRKMTELTFLSIKMDASQFSLAMLWSVCQARRLRKLRLSVYYSYRDSAQEYDASEFLSVFDCCAHVPEVQVADSFMAPKRVKSSESYYNWMRRKLKVLELAPANTAEALSRPLSWSSTLRLLKRPSGSCNFRKLKISTEGMNRHVFRSLITKCRLLEELDIYMTRLSIDESTWSFVAVSCPKLQILAIRHGNESAVVPPRAVLVNLFPKVKLSIM